MQNKEVNRRGGVAVIQLDSQMQNKEVNRRGGVPLELDFAWV